MVIIVVDMLDIRPFVYSSDLTALRTIELQRFEQPLTTILIDFLLKRFGDRYWQVAYHGQSIIGHIAAGVENGHDLHIFSIAIDSDHEGHGVASKLLDTVIKMARYDGLTSVYLEVKEQNERAIHLYAHKGFVTEKLMEEYYEDLSNGELMRLHLK